MARSVVWDGARLAVAGLLVGGGAALLGTRVLQSILAAAVPAWRASRKAPADALGTE